MNLSQLQLVHEAMAEGVEAARQGDHATSGERWKEAANLALAADDIQETVRDKQEAIEVLQTLEKNLAEEGKFIEVAVLLWGNGMFDSRPSVVQSVFEEVKNNSKLIILGGSSLSKCLGPDVRVLMFDGTTKAAKDIKEGDVLMGDDSKPRNVLAAHAGHGPMYRIIPERGDPWTCNDEHILSLRYSSTKMCGGSGLPSSYRIRGAVRDIPIKEYIGLAKNQKFSLKQFSVGVEFPERNLPIDPYIYGAWLGDGCTTMPSLHTPDGPMPRRWCEYWNSYPGMKAVSLKQKPGKCAAWRASKSTTAKGANPFSEFMKTSVSDGKKFIREDYLINSRSNRLKLLAGLLDADGWLQGGTAYGFSGRDEPFVRQVSSLARSLGFASFVTSRIHTIKSIGFSGVYWHTRVSGEGVSEIPCLEKPCRESTSFKDMTNTGFRVEPIGDGPYNGFLIDGNHRFLLSDYTVTHNTFSCGVLFYIFWRMDPYWTAVKLAAPSEDHLYTNLFSHLVALHKGAVIPMTDDDTNKVKVNETDMFISMNDALPEMRIQGVLCKQSQVSAGALRGHKPKPYRKPVHPKYGNSTRLFILIDEGTQVSPGAFEDIKTTEASIDPAMDTVKIVMPCNPEGITYKIVQMAEPEEGWDADQVDTLYKWTSKQGYPVLRLDGKRFENVVERKTIYPRMLTYEAFLGFLRSGEHSAAYWAKGRGFPPLKDNAYTIIPPSWVQSQRGDPIYVGKVENIAALDTALGGGDKAIFGVGRWGEAAGWTRADGKTEWFVNRADPSTKITKYVCVADQLFELPKTTSATEMAQEVMGRCKGMGIPPENVVMDKGGNAAGVWSHLKTVWGDVLGVENGVKASEERVLSDDHMTAYDTYNLKATELWFAFKRWLDPIVCAMLINPIIPTSPLFTQLTTRRYYNVKGGRVQVEAKEIYRARNQGASPDESDCTQLFVEWCRQRGKVLPGIMEAKNEHEDGAPERVSLKNADEYETLGTEAAWQPNRLDAEE